MTGANAKGPNAPRTGQSYFPFDRYYMVFLRVLCGYSGGGTYHYNRAPVAAVNTTPEQPSRQCPAGGVDRAASTLRKSASRSTPPAGRGASATGETSNVASHGIRLRAGRYLKPTCAAWRRQVTASPQPCAAVTASTVHRPRFVVTITDSCVIAKTTKRISPGGPHDASPGNARARSAVPDNPVPRIRLQSVGCREQKDNCADRRSLSAKTSNCRG